MKTKSVKREKRIKDDGNETDSSSSDSGSSLSESSSCSDDDSDSSKKERCPICLNKFKEQDIAIPNSCSHEFCLECLEEWSRVCFNYLF